MDFTYLLLVQICNILKYYKIWTQVFQYTLGQEPQ